MPGHRYGRGTDLHRVAENVGINVMDAIRAWWKMLA